MDHAGPFLGKYFLVVVDAYSKWIEAKIVPSTSSEVTIKVLTNLFANFGLPRILVSDNATGFTSAAFQSFCSANGIKHVRISAYHPRSNGQAERSVQLIKNALKRNDHPDLEMRLNKVLFGYRTTPHSSTGVSPAELLQGRKLRTYLDLLTPPDPKPVKDSFSHAYGRNFQPGQKVLVRDIIRKKWIPSVVTKRIGPLDRCV